MMPELRSTALALTATAALALPAAGEGRPLNFDQDKAYEHVIVPIFAKSCTGCHGAEKAKGKIRLHTPEEIAASETVVPGNPDDSETVVRIFLPADDEDVMPPEDKEPLTDAEKALIRWWIAGGADYEKTIAEIGVGDDVQPLLTAYQYSAPKVVEIKKAFDLPEPAGEADPAAVAAIDEAGVLIMPLAQDTKYLSANALNVAKSFDDSGVKQLVGVASHLTWLDLSRTGVTDAAAADLGKLTQLTKLHLENTGVGDATLAEVAKLPHLEYLNVYGTQVTDAGLAHLKGLTKLKNLYVWQTGVTEEGAKALEEAIPGLEVNTGWKAPAPQPEGEKKDGQKEG